MYKYSVTILYSAENKREYLFKTEEDADKFCLSMQNPMLVIRKKEVKVRVD